MRALIVESNPTDARRLILELGSGGRAVEAEVVATAAEARAALTERPWDAILTEWAISDFGALPLLAVVRELGIDAPVIIVAGSITEDVAVSAMRAGARDFVLKDRLARLVPAVERELREAETRAARRRLEDQLRQAQKMEAIGRLAGGIAHDFNNLLCVIASYSETLLAALPPGDMRDDAEQIQLAGRRGAALTRQLLMFTRQQVVEPRVLDLNAVLTELAKMVQRLVGNDIELLWRMAPRIPAVHADQSSIEQVIVNLIVNARDAMPRGGQLTLETAGVVLDEAYARAHVGVTAGPHVMLAVSDTGVGMDRATQARIFEPFFTTKERGGGTGLGLSTVFGIVQQNRGHVEVASEPGRGTGFRIYLPATEAAAPEPPEPTAPLSGSETILLVEDDNQVRAVALTILRKHGYLVLAAQDAGDAQAACENHPHPIHLVLTDMVVPGGTGPALARRLLAIRPDMKVLCLTGPVDEVSRDPADPPVALLRKPFTAEALARSVRKLLEVRG